MTLTTPRDSLKSFAGSETAKLAFLWCLIEWVSLFPWMQPSDPRVVFGGGASGLSLERSRPWDYERTQLILEYAFVSSFRFLRRCSKEWASQTDRWQRAPKSTTKTQPSFLHVVWRQTSPFIVTSGQCQIIFTMSRILRLKFNAYVKEMTLQDQSRFVWNDHR